MLSRMQVCCRAKGTFRQRVWYTACNDPITFMYFIIFPFTFIWVTMGLSEVNSFNGGIDGCRLVSTLLWILSTATYVYLIGTFLVASVSMCWEGKRVSDLKKLQKSQQQTTPPPTANLAHLFAPNFGAGHGAAHHAPSVLPTADVLTFNALELSTVLRIV